MNLFLGFTWFPNVFTYDEYVIIMNIRQKLSESHMQTFLAMFTPERHQGSHNFQVIFILFFHKIAQH